MRYTILLTSAAILCAAAMPIEAAKKSKPVKVSTDKAIQVAPVPVKDPTAQFPGPEGCPPPAQGGEAAADWRPPPIPPKETMPAGGQPVDGGEAASDWRPPPIPPKVASGGDEAAQDWRPPPIPPATANGCIPQGSESADWRPPPIPPK